MPFDSIDRNISVSLSCLAISATWVAGAYLTFGDWLGIAPDKSGYAGVTLVALGHLLATRRCIRKQAATLRERERNAYELGRDRALHVVEGDTSERR